MTTALHLPSLVQEMQAPCLASGNLVSHLADNNSSHLAANTSSATMLESTTSFPYHPSIIGKMPMFLLRPSLHCASIHGAW